MATLEYEGGLVAPEAAALPAEPPAATLDPPAPEEPSERDAASDAHAAEENGGGLRAAGNARGQRYGLSLQFEARPGDPELGRLIENTVWINTDHAAWQRAEATRSTGYHIAVAVALALAPLATGGGGVQQFLTAFLAQWGESVRGEKKGKAAGRRGR